jgi:predicted dehydrogenase
MPDVEPRRYRVLLADYNGELLRSTALRKTNSLTRREFVRIGGAVAAGAALNTTLLEPQQLWAVDADANRVRYASIGMGVRGCDVLKAALQVPGGECVGISDLFDGRLRAGREIAAKDTPETKNYKELLDRKDIDAVIIAVPDHLHRRIVEDACAAGKDVYCEKPMSHTLDDGFKMLDAARKNNRVLQIGSQRVSSVTCDKAREIYQSGKLGNVYMIEAHSDRNSPSGAWVYPIPPDATAETIDWAGFIQDAPARPFDAVRFFRWRCFKDYGEGLAGDLYVHLLSGIQFITGVTAPPIRAHSSGGLYHFKDGRDFPDLINTLYEYPKFQAYLRCNLNNEAGENITFRGNKGTMVVEYGRVTFTPQDTRPQPEGYSINGWPSDLRAQYLAEWQKEHPPTPPLESTVSPETEVFEAPHGYNDTVDHVANFFNSVRTRRAPVENGDFGNSAAIACHMANYSYFNRRSAIWDSGAQTIRS